MIEDKTTLLELFISDNKHLPDQKSESWKADRTRIIGSSEISIITGDNHFSSIRQLIHNKTGINSFKGNLATKWGSIFEPITASLFKLLFMKQGEIYETGSISNDRIKNHRCSPDGLCVLSIDSVPYIVLLEFKAPLNSIPYKTVPKHYIPQIMSGMCIIDITEKSVFVNNMFRKCSINHLGDNMFYDKEFHGNKNTSLIKHPIAYGLMIFYVKPKNKDNFYTRLREDKSEYLPYPEDYGINDTNLEYTMTLAIEGIVSIKYTQPTLVESDSKELFMSNELLSTYRETPKDYKARDYNEVLLEFEERCIKRSVPLLGYLPWKLLKSSNIIVDKDPDYVKGYQEDIDDVIDIINKVSDIGCVIKRSEEINNLLIKRTVKKMIVEDHDYSSSSSSLLDDEDDS
jgi:hypothetical protein